MARRYGDRAWIALAIGAMLLGATSMASSIAAGYAPGGFLLAQAILSAVPVGCGVVARRRAGGGSDREVEEPATRTPLGPGEWAMVVALVALLGLSGLERSLTPLHNVDDLMYHGSRAAYWVQGESVLLRPTHNERQTAFPFGAELIFAWPLLFTGSDLPGRLMHWLAIPLATVGVFSVARAAGAGRVAGLFAALLYAATPAVLTLATTLKADIWTPVFILGAGYWIARAADAPRHVVRALFWAGAFVALAMNVKVIIAAVVPVLVLAPLAVAPWKQAMRAIVASAAGGVAAVLFSGLAVVLTSNMIRYDHPLGPEVISAAVQPDYTPRQMYVHLVRVPIFLLEFPEVPTQSLRAAIEDLRRGLTVALNGDEQLPREDKPHWPGAFSYQAPPYALHFGLGGLLWLPLLAAGVVILTREVLWRRPRGRLSGISLLIVAQLLMFTAVVFMIRWMGGGPDRFWLAPYAISLATGVAILARCRPLRTALGALAVIAATAAAYPVVRQMLVRIDQRDHPRFSSARYRFAPALEYIPEGSTILLIGSWNAQDYPLLAPEGRLVNRVIPWGKQAFDPDLLEQTLQREQIEFVLFENGRSVRHLEPGDINTAPMVQWLIERPGANHLPLEGAGMIRLFALSEGQQTDER